MQPKWWPLTRDIALFVVGVLGVINEAIHYHAERPLLLMTFAAMMGLPAFIRPSSGAK